MRDSPHARRGSWHSRSACCTDSGSRARSPRSACHTGQIPLALLFFNVGVEAGQLLFVAAVFAFTWPVRRARIAMPGWAGLVPPYAIGSVAMFWVIERIAAF